MTPAGLHVHENDIIVVGCSIKFSGNIVPNTDCRWSVGNRWENVTSLITNSTVRVQWSVLATSSLESQHIQCTTHVVNDSVRSAEQSAGRPLYQHTWTSPVVQLVGGRLTMSLLNQKLSCRRDACLLYTSDAADE